MKQTRNKKTNKNKAPGYIQASIKLLLAAGVTIKDDKVFVAMNIGDDEVVELNMEDPDFSYVLDSALNQHTTLILKQKDYAPWAIALRYLHTFLPWASEWIVEQSDQLVDATLDSFENGDYQPVFAFEKVQGISKSHSADWYKKAKKHLEMRADMRIKTAIYYVRGYINSGTVNYSVDDISVDSSGLFDVQDPSKDGE